ncbi:MAG: hypothetical protein IKN78_07575 [Bacteroidales bacterium]|nr:hypothetical protein [Bacteroidales bacterium]
MNRNILILLVTALLLAGCQNMQQKKLNRQMKKMAKIYLQQEEIKDYKDLTITSVDTLTEFSYAKLNSELLGNMADAYEQMYWDEEDSAKREVIGLSFRETKRTQRDMDDLIDNGDLLTQGVLLFMVTGNYKKDNENQEFMFLVNPDKKSLHYLDPFGNNLLYQDEE